MRTTLFPVLFAVATLSLAAPLHAGDDVATSSDPIAYEVTQEDTFVYEQPSAQSPVLRRLFPGEVIACIASVAADDGAAFAVITIGPKRRGYVPLSKLDRAGRFPHRRWHKTVIIRDERPLAVSGRGLGETHGASLNVRYLPFTRVGMSLGVGPTVVDRAIHGTALTAGFLFFGSTRNLSPFFDLGVTRLSYHETRTKLQITAMYVTLGLEWMASWGGFLCAGVTYIRSMDVSITVKHDDAMGNSFEFGTYGSLGKDIEDGELYQAVQPAFSVGYGF